MRIIVGRRAHILLPLVAGGWNHLGIRPNLHLNSTRVLFQKVVKDILFKKTGIAATLDVNGVNLQEVARALTARFHFDFRCVHNITLPFST